MLATLVDLVVLTYTGEFPLVPLMLELPKSMPGTRGDALKMGYDWKAPFSGKSNLVATQQIC